MRHRRAVVHLATFLIASMASAGLVPQSAEADTRLVNCAAGRRIASALRLPAGRELTITVQGACTENVSITRDHVTIQGAPGASIAPADAAQATILIDGARRVRLQNLTITGGEGAIVGTSHALFEVVNVTARGGTRYGIIASYAAVGTIDGSTIENVDGDGISAANNASVVVTNSTVQNNTGTGISGSRNAHVRVGQDRHGSTTVKPVTISGNGSNGVTISHSSAGIIVGGSVSNNHGSNVFVGRGSSTQIGFGVQSLTGAITIQNSTAGSGVFIEGGNATILNATIAGNAHQGVVVTNGGSARIGIKNDSSGYAANTISGNGSSGIHIAGSSSAFIGGTTIRANGTDSTRSRYGIFVNQAAAYLAGNNVIENHPQTGILARAGTVLIGDSSFGLPTDNTIRGNGTAGGDRGGVFAFQGGVIQARGATITGNTGGGGVAYEGGIIEFRQGTVISANAAVAGVSADDFNGGHGIVAFFNSVVRLRDTGTAVQNNAGHGVEIASGSVVDFRSVSPPASVSVTGNTGFGLKCFVATNYSGDVTGVTGNAGGGNVDQATNNIANCSRF